MTGGTPGERPRTTPFAAVPGLALAVPGLVVLAAVVGLLPFLGDENVSFPEQVLSYLLAIVPSGALVTASSPSSTRASARLLSC